jgi:hypothetical protein
MEHVSRPMQALLVATVAFALLWFVALRPKADAGGEPAAAAPPAPAQTTPAKPRSAIPGGLGKSVDKARETKSTGDVAAAVQDGKPVAAVTPTPPAGAATTAKPAPAVAKPKPKPVAAKGAPAGLRRALARGHVAVLLFYSSASSDDRAVRDEVAGVSRRGGKVYVKAVRVSKLSRYREVLTGVQVLQTPSVVILRKGKDPVLLAGYTDRKEIDQISAALLRKRR